MTTPSGFVTADRIQVERIEVVKWRSRYGLNPDRARTDPAYFAASQLRRP